MHSIEVVPSFTPVPSCKPLLEWFMTEYLSDHSVDLTVVYMPLSDEGVTGWCMRESDYEFVIQIDENLRGDEHDKTLLHEMYHCMQHLMGIPRCEMCANLSENLLLDKYNNQD
ncbi:hypothetical protein [Synechococcus phage S-B05]|nr:hypothetical protein [Synechococcus phage S-B05]